MSLQLLHSGGKSKSYSHIYKYNPDGTSTAQSANNNYSIKLNHALGARNFYEANLSFSNTNYMGYQFKPIDLNSAVHEDEADRFGAGQYVLFNQFEDNNTSIHKNLWGYGLGVTLTSPVGPLEFVWSKGPKSFSEPVNTHFLFSFNAGYKF